MSSDRAELQARLDGERDRAARNRLGQHATPPALAAALVARALAQLPADRPLRFLDPALGLGGLYAALQQERGARPLEAALGVERDPRFAAHAAALWPGLEVREADFTRLSPDFRATLLVSNPPYVRHHHLPPEEKARLAALVRARTGLALPGLAGLYVSFLLLSRAWMAEGGVAAWLVPAEILDTGYAAVARRHLVEQVELLEIHRLDPGDPQFPEATVSSAVLLLRNAPPLPGARVRLYAGAPGRDAPARELPLEALAGAPRWSPLFGEAAPEIEGPSLGELFEIRRGVATGANDLFVLQRSKARALQLPEEALRPILPGPRGLRCERVEAEPDGWPRLPEPLALISTTLDEPTLRERHPALWRYLESGRARVATRYLCRHRDPWYAQERREPAPLLCSYMGRGERPFRFVLNRSRAIAPNTWLMLWPRPALAARIGEDPALLERIRDQLAGLALPALRREARVYGGALHKLEPRELGRLRVPL